MSGTLRHQIVSKLDDASKVPDTFFDRSETVRRIAEALQQAPTPPVPSDWIQQSDHGRFPGLPVA